MARAGDELSNRVVMTRSGEPDTSPQARAISRAARRPANGPAPEQFPPS